MADETTPAAPATPAAPMHVIENVSLESFEKAVYSRDYERAGAELVNSLRRLKQGATFIGYVSDPRVLAVLYSRYCAAVISLFADPQFHLSQDGFHHLAAEHAIMDLVFRASVFETSDHLLPQISSNPAEADKTKLRMTDGEALVKFLLTYSLRSAASLNFEATFKRSPQTTVSLWAGMCSPLLTVAVQAQERREALLGMYPIFEGVRLPDAILPTLSDAYMYSSYGVRRDKHDMKGLIHRLLAARMRETKAPIPTPAQLLERTNATKASEAKPRILICCEWFTSLHAMYRCYAPIIRQLRERFYLVGMSRDMDTDAQGKAEFDEWHPVPTEQLTLSGLIEQINAIAPDVIYYPSIGMAMWWVAMASVRLAPVQVMTLGHPASSRSMAIDYVLCDEGSIGDPSLFTEKIVEYPNGSARYLMRPDAVMPELLHEDHPETVHIAVPAMLCKLNATFMQTLRAIRDQAARPTEFHFFINMLGVNLHQSAREIRDWLPGAKIYERTSYTQYLEHLRKCHLHLCSFPFGGTNSNIDSMLLGIPLVALEGDQPHERFDAMMLRRAGLPDNVATTREGYIERAAQLIASDDDRNAQRDHLRAFDLQGEFFGEPPEAQSTAFVDAMWQCYQQGAPHAA